MTLHHGDCLDVMPTLPADSVDAIVTDPPYGLEFMGKEWDSFRVDDPGTARNRGANAGEHGSIKVRTFGADGRPKAKVSYGGGDRPTTSRCTGCGKRDQWRNPHDCVEGATWKALLLDPHAAPPTMLAFQEWSRRWAEAAYRVAKPSAYLLAFGGTRTVHRLTCALEDAGWIIRDLLVWAYASGFPKSKASLKPAWEPIVMARKPGPLRMLNIDDCRIGTTKDVPASPSQMADVRTHGKFGPTPTDTEGWNPQSGRWPANVVLSDAVFDGGWDGVVGGGETASTVGIGQSTHPWLGGGRWSAENTYGDSGTYSRFFLVPKADRADREPVLRPDWAEPGKRASSHPTVKPTDLMRHLVRLVTPTGGVVLDPFLGSGTTAIAAEMEGFAWIGIEREAEYVAIAEARLNGTQRGLGLPA